ncbi:hypothetical protein M6I34_14045 [Burkholderiaceae bacterium FT117]|uniref:hypothetical protein n=1 Tax=Zeimonas sediminis TaxID=2944268 RepID=UPI002343230F|nr:hypothetical protein [Zeimonas sediminis]MCM5571639.1 hypothetical protein [Zeimonas sediminis]
MSNSLPGLRALRLAHAALIAACAAGFAGAQPAVAQPGPAAPPGAVAQPGAPARSSSALPSPVELDRLAADSVRRWESSEHGQMLVRILPRRLEPSGLPEPESEGARLTALYCVQCHHLPSPAMHDAASWPKIVDRMLPRMRGEGNLGQLMARMMVGPSAAAPAPAEVEAIVAYLARHALEPLGASASPALRQELAVGDGRMFAQACSQCHALPDPARHRADDWPEVVRRMEGYMQWLNRVASGTDPREPKLRPAAITAFLQRHARPSASR